MNLLALLLACGVPELQILYQNNPIEKEAIISIAELRQFQDFPSLQFQLQNKE